MTSRAICIAALLCGFANATPALACAVPTSLRVENQSGQVARRIFVSAPHVGSNQAPEGGLAPGATATITLPSCMGIYAVTAILTDRTERRHDRLDATNIRGITLR